MSTTLCEQLLSRVLAYMEGVGVIITPDIASQALALVEQALRRPDMDPFALVMQRLPETFHLPHLSLPPLAPPINRGSIGYNRS